MTALTTEMITGRVGPIFGKGQARLENGQVVTVHNFSVSTISPNSYVWADQDPWEKWFIVSSEAN